MQLAVKSCLLWGSFFFAVPQNTVPSLPYPC